MKEKEKKKKLTLTISTKKPINIPKYSQGKNKTSVVVEKKFTRNRNERRFYGQNDNIRKPASGTASKNKPQFKGNFPSKNVDWGSVSKIRSFSVTLFKRYRS